MPREFSRRAAIALLAAAPILARPGLPGAGEPVRMRTLYNPDRSFSDLARALEGQRIQVPSYMAPPLVAFSRFFIAADRPMASCPFCDTESEWPDDIIAVYAKRVVEVVPFYKQIVVEGVLRLGSFEDPETGFVSQARLDDATYALA